MGETLMLGWLDYRAELFRLYRKEKRLDRQRDRRFAEAQSNKNMDTFVDWYNNFAQAEYQGIRWERQRLLSDALLGCCIMPA